MHHPRPAYPLVGDVAVGLQNPGERRQEPLRPLASPPQLEVEDRAASWPAVLPQLRLLVFPPPIVHLHIHRCLVGLNVTAAE